jgi:hypothetical protein
MKNNIPSKFLFFTVLPMIKNFFSIQFTPIKLNNEIELILFNLISKLNDLFLLIGIIY